MVTFMKWLWSKILCDHQWRYLDTVKDQDLRSGYRFWSDRFICRRCDRIQTVEKRDQAQ